MYKKLIKLLAMSSVAYTLFLLPIAESPPMQISAASSQASTSMGIITVGSAIVRSGISLDTAELTTLSRNTVVQILGTSGTRINIRVGNTVGWTNASFVEAYRQQGIMTAANANVRSGIAVDSTWLTTPARYDFVQILGHSSAGGRVHIQVGNTVGWAGADFVGVGGKAGGVNTSSHIRQGIAITSESIRVLSSGTSVMVLGENAARTRLKVQERGERDTIGWIGSGTATLLTLGTNYYMEREAPLRIRPRLNSEASTIALQGTRVRLVSGAVISSTSTCRRITENRYRQRVTEYVRVEILPNASYPTAIRGYIQSKQLTRTSPGFQTDRIPLTRKTNIYNHSVRLLSAYSNTWYSNSVTAAAPYRSLGYHNLRRRNPDTNRLEYTFDCASFVAAVLDRAMGRSPANGRFLREHTFTWNGTIRRSPWGPRAFFDNQSAPSSERKFQRISRVRAGGSATRIMVSSLQVGDVIQGRHTENAGHLLIYVGDGDVIHASSGNRGIVRDNLRTDAPNPNLTRGARCWIQLGRCTNTFRFNEEIAILRYLGN